LAVLRGVNAFHRSIHSIAVAERPKMPGLVVATLLIGAALGMRFKVLILVPAFGLLLVVTLAAARAHGSAAPAFFVTAALAFAGLQIGYLCGALMRFYLRANAGGRLPRSLKAAGRGPEATPYPAET
jgi:hypothetical protein